MEKDYVRFIPEAIHWMYFKWIRDFSVKNEITQILVKHGQYLYSLAVGKSDLY